jgi:hypothetical protein
MRRFTFHKLCWRLAFQISFIRFHPGLGPWPGSGDTVCKTQNEVFSTAQKHTENRDTETPGTNPGAQTHKHKPSALIYASIIKNMSFAVGNFFQLETLNYVPFVNLVAQLLDNKDPPTPEELSEALNGTGLISALVLGIVVSTVQAFGYEDYMDAMERWGINATTGENDWEDGADPYSLWIIACTNSIAALLGALLITIVLMVHQSSTDFHDTDNEYSIVLRRAWWKWVRFAQALNIFLMVLGSYYVLYAVELSAFLLLPNPGGSIRGATDGAIDALVDSDWTQKHKYNFCNY